MTDRELLELAAKAAGIDGKYCDIEGDESIWWNSEDDYVIEWNPLTDDGDALRLAVKLKLPMQFPDWSDVTRTWAGKNDYKPLDERHDADPYAATRRAIVRSAAEIGRTK